MTSRGNEQKKIFKNRRDREKFLEYGCVEVSNYTYVNNIPASDCQTSANNSELGNQGYHRQEGALLLKQNLIKSLKEKYRSSKRNCLSEE